MNEFAAAAPLADAGLSRAEAARRLASEGPNALPGGQRRTLLSIALETVREPMFLLLLAAGTLYLVFGDLQEGVTLFGFVLVTLGLTLYQEGKTERAIEALRDLTSPRALVIRDGQPQRIAGRDVVRGDLLQLNEGDRLPADALLVSADGLRVDESLLTGEAVPVGKLAAAPVFDCAAANATVVTHRMFREVVAHELDGFEMFAMRPDLFGLIVLRIVNPRQVIIENKFLDAIGDGTQLHAVNAALQKVVTCRRDQRCVVPAAGDVPRNAHPIRRSEIHRRAHVTRLLRSGVRQRADRRNRAGRSHRGSGRDPVFGVHPRVIRLILEARGTLDRTIIHIAGLN